MAEVKKKRASSLRKKWMINSVVPVITILLLIATLVSIALGSNYYSSAKSSLETKARTGAEYFNDYVMTSYNEYYRDAVNYASNYADKATIELQFLNASGKVEVSSRDVMVGSYPGTTEISNALQSGETSYFRGKDPSTGERIIAVSSLLKFDGTVVGIMRYVTATRSIDGQVVLTIVVIFSIAIAVIVLIAMSSLIFINNVVAPVSAVSEAAKKIASGSYGIVVENPYTDEMGELIDNMNQMSVEIGQNEKMRTDFISSVSHELRTPLTAINGWTETLLNENIDQDSMHRGLSIIQKEANRLTKMVEELLDFSKIEGGRFTLNLEPTDLQAEFEDAVFTYREIFKKQQIEVNYSSGQEIYTDFITADGERLKQVFCNVLDNAAKHGGSGKRIDTTMNQEGKKYVITVRDYGPGIPPKELPYVKQKFYKGSSKARGSGIGLAVCDEIIKLHEGTFTIGNAKGGGTIVTIKLPIQKKNS